MAETTGNSPAGTPPAQNTGTSTPNGSADPSKVPGGNSGEQTGANGSVDPSTAAAKEAMRKFKIKHDDGLEEEVDEEVVLKTYRERKGHQRAANKELQEGKSAKKQAETFVKMMKDEGQLFDAIKKLGHDPRKLAEKYLAAQLEDDLLDPKEKDLRTARAKIAQYEARENAEKEAREKAHADSLKAKYSKEYSEQFVEALKESKLPPTKETVAKMAKYIRSAAQLKVPMSATEAAKLVREDIDSEHRSIYGESDPETLVRIIGEAGVQKLRAYDVSKVKDPAANLRTPENQGDPKLRKNSGQAMTPSEWRRYNRS